MLCLVNTQATLSLRAYAPRYNMPPTPRAASGLKFFFLRITGVARATSALDPCLCYFAPAGLENLANLRFAAEGSFYCLPAATSEIAPCGAARLWRQMPPQCMGASLWASGIFESPLYGGEIT